MDNNRSEEASGKPISPAVSAITVYAPAKLNLFLDIVGRRDDGYHLMDMVMQTVDLCDKVTISLADAEGFSLSCDGEDVPNDGSNTAVRAAKTFFCRIGAKAPGLHIAIDKSIPSQAGLGGASSDAAAVFVGLNEMFGCGLSVTDLCELGVRVGADVPFCILGGTARAEGVGELLTPMPALPEGCRFVIVKPDYGVSTVEAFAQFDSLPEKPSAPDISRICGAIASADAPALGGCLANVFEAVVFPGKTSEIKRELLANGAAGAVMSGSGSSVFGLFSDASSAERAAAALRRFGLTFVAAPISRGAYILGG